MCVFLHSFFGFFIITDLNYHTLEPRGPISAVLHQASLIMQDDFPNAYNYSNYNDSQNRLNHEDFNEMHETQCSSSVENHFYENSLNKENNFNSINGLKEVFTKPDAFCKMQKSQIMHNDKTLNESGIEVMDLSSKPLDNITTYQQNSCEISNSFNSTNQKSQNELNYDPKIENSIYQLLLSSHRGRVLLKAYEELQKKYQVSKLQSEAEISISEDSESSAQDDDDVSDDETQFIKSTNKIEKLFSKGKLCAHVMEHEVNLNCYE